MMKLIGKCHQIEPSRGGIRKKRKREKERRRGKGIKESEKGVSRSPCV